MIPPDRSSTFFQAIIESARDQIFTVDRRYCYTTFNAPHAAAMKAAYGIRIAVGMSHLDCIRSESDRAATKGCIDRALRGKANTAESIITGRAKGHVHYRLSFNPLRARSGAVRGVAVFATDITKHVKAETALRTQRARMREDLKESAEMFRFVFHNAYDGISLFEEHADPLRRRLIECNERYAELAGRSREELLRVGHTIQLAKVLRERTVRSVRHGVVFTGAFTWLRPDRKDNIIEYTAVSIKVRGKTLTIGIDRDVTQQRRAEEQLERNLRETQVRYEVSQALAGKETEDEVLDALMEHSRLLPQAHAAIVTMDPAGTATVGILRRADTVAQGQPYPLRPGTRFPETQFTAMKYYSGDRPFVVDDVSADPRLDTDTRGTLLGMGDRSYAVFPIVADRTRLGWISVSSAEHAFFTEEKQHLYATLAEQGAVALRATRLREAIRQSQQRLTLLIEQSPLAVIEWNTAFEVRSWNSAAERIFGYRRQEALTRQAVGLILPEDARPAIDQDWQSLISQRSGTHDVKENITKSGRRITCDWFNAPLVSADGQVIGVVSLIEDVTERKRSEAALRLTSFALERVADAVYWMDRDGRIVDVNEAACRALGYTKAEFVGMSLGDIDPHWSTRSWPETWESLKRQGTLTRETQHRTKDGRIIDVEIVANFIRFGGRELDCALARDITQRKQAEEAVRQSEHLLKEAQRVAHLGHYSLDIVRGEWTSSEVLDDVLGIDRHYIRDMEGWMQIIHPNQRQEFSRYFSRNVLIDHESVDQELRIVRPADRQIRWVHARGELKLDEDNNPVKILGTVQDITDRKNAEEALRQSEEQYRAIVNAVPDLLFRVTADGYILDYSAPNTSLLFAPPEIFLRKNIKDVLPPQIAEPATTCIAKALRSREMVTFEYELPIRGEPRFFENRIVPLSKDEVLSVTRDITDQRRAEERIRASLREKEFLLKEIHHRVKNNLQIIASLLNLQSERATDERILTQFHEAQNRVRSIAMVHEKLYRSTNLADINFSDYLHDVVAGLMRAYGNAKARLHLDIEDVRLGIDVAIPCGLIINELVSNALKYAFPAGREGTLSLTMHALPPDSLVLSVHDDGIGIPENVDPFEHDTLGMTVVSILVQQLNGKVELDRTAGTRFTITFKRTSS